MTFATLETRSTQSDSDAGIDRAGLHGDTLLDLILTRVRLCARRRVAWLAHLAGSSDSIEMEADAALIAALDDRDHPDAEGAWYASSAQLQPLNEAIDEVERTLMGEPGARLRELGVLFQLNAYELDTLQACLALAIEPALGTVCTHLQRHPARTYVTEPMVARLFGHGRCAVWTAASPLAAWGLVIPGDAPPGEPLPLTLDPLVIAWLQGELRVDPGLAGKVRTIEQQAPLPGWPVDATVRFMEQAMERVWAVRVQVCGSHASGRRSFAAAVAARFGMQTLSVDTSAVADADWPDVFMRAQRLAVLGGMALVWHGSGIHRRWPAAVVPAPVQFVASDADESLPACEYVTDHRVAMPALTLDERRSLWTSMLPDSAAWSDQARDTLATRYRLSVGDIAAVARHAPADAHQAAALACEQTRHRLGRLGLPLDCPFSWDDLVVPDRLRQALEDYTFEARDRVTFWESTSAQRLFPRGRGLSALFSGPPGTGKTMAAQVIAAELGLDLVRVDLAAVVSKYIGETAKHLNRIFAGAERMNAVLFFDEADALFSKRTDVKDYHDRHANSDTGYLLQLLEEHDGIVILASNRKQNIDAAFTRRMRYLLDFPRPEAVERRRILQRVIGELTSEDMRQRLATTIDTIAHHVELSGAQIKNAVLAALFIARCKQETLAMPHLIKGIERELGKDGRALTTHERERLQKDG